MIKSSRCSVASISMQKASTLGVCRRSRPKMTSRLLHSGKLRPRAVGGRGVGGEARGADKPRPATKRLGPPLFPVLPPPAGEQGDPPTQVGELRSLREVLLGAGGAQPVVEMV